MKYGVWNGATMESFWQARAKTKVSLYGLLGCVSFRLLTLRCTYTVLAMHSQVEILTYSFTNTYKTIHLLLDASRGHWTIVYCCHLLNSISRCGIPRLAGHTHSVRRHLIPS